MIEIYCDGSCKRNGKEDNCGGFGVCVLIPDQRFKSGYYIDFWHNYQEYDTTNNRMEVEGLILAIDLAQTLYKDQKCIIYCDSRYCVNMCSDWIWIWAKNGWLNSQKKTVENIDLVYKLYCKLVKSNFPNYTIQKIRGHDNNLGNDLADALAKNDGDKIAKILKENNEIHVKIENFDNL